MVINLFTMVIQKSYPAPLGAGFSATNALANAGIRVRWNIWNLYIHLCWRTVEQQSIPALAIASDVMANTSSENWQR